MPPRMSYTKPRGVSICCRCGCTTYFSGQAQLDSRHIQLLRWIKVSTIQRRETAHRKNYHISRAVRDCPERGELAMREGGKGEDGEKGVAKHDVFRMLPFNSILDFG